jgi:hypothetical protein
VGTSKVNAMCIKRTVLLSIIALSVLGGCDSSANVDGQEQRHTESQQTRWVSGMDTYRVDQLNAGVGNGGHTLGTYDPAHFSASKAKQDLVASDERRGCPGRARSVSQATGIAAVDTFLTDQAPFVLAAENEELDEGLNAAWLDQLMRDIVSDEENLGVFSSVYDLDGEDDPVHCAYWTFDVYRKNGTVIRFDFDWGD